MKEEKSRDVLTRRQLLRRYKDDILSSFRRLELFLQFLEGVLRLNDSSVGGGDERPAVFQGSDGGASTAVAQQTGDAGGRDFLPLHRLRGFLLTFALHNVELQSHE